MIESERLFLAWAYASLQEINPRNYDHNDVCSMNAASVEVMLAIKARLDGLKALENGPASLADATPENHRSYHAREQGQ